MGNDKEFSTWLVVKVPIHCSSGESDDIEKVTHAKCTICTWKLGKPKTLQLNIDTIEKHIGKVYENKS